METVHCTFVTLTQSGVTEGVSEFKMRV